MERPITSHVASVPPRPPRPGFVAFEPRAVLALCHCAQRVSGVWYARSGCIVCNGGGHRAVSAEVRGG